jgi:hypothetical protein
MNRPHLDDRPLNIEDATSLSQGIPQLAQRLAAHLGSSWEVCPEYKPLAMVLRADGDRRLRMRYVHKEEQHLVQLFTLDLNAKPIYDITMNLFQLPSHMAAHLKEHVLPNYRRRLDRLRHDREHAHALRGAHRGHAQSVADRLGNEWQVVPSLGSVRVEQPARGHRIFGEINWWTDGHISIELGRLTPELIEHIVDGIQEQVRLHERNRIAWGKRPKRLNYLLELMIGAGYRIDKLGPEHEELFGKPMFKMGLRVAPGDDLVSYVLERQDRLDRAIRVLETRPEEG